MSDLKVSVIVPAYMPGEGFQRVVGSLAQQTMPQDEFELIVVDDGSPDDTWDMLRREAAVRPNMRIERIENSGWPSRPRNVGITAARGEYLLFMDHDDEIFPDGLRASYEYAVAHRADVLSPKELKTSDPTWGLGNFTENIPNALPARGIDALLPMMPHKFYRRQFLLDHDIRFPEGRRMLWEDIYFNVACFKHADVVSILSDTPVYLWHSTDANNSATYGPADDEFWDRLEQLIDFIATTLDPADEREAVARKKQLLHQYRLRVLGRMAGYLKSGERPERREYAAARARAIAEKHIPVEWDLDLPAASRPQAWLLRHDRLDLMRDLQVLDVETVGLAQTTSVEWVDGRLVIEAVARWTGNDGRPAAFRSDGERVWRVLPERFSEIPAEYLDVTAAVRSASSVLTVRDRYEHGTWALPTTQERTLEAIDGQSGLVTPVVRTRAILDPGTGAQGGPLGDTVWDVRAKNTLLGNINHRGLRTTSATRPALVDGRAMVAYRNNSRALTLDTAQRLRSLVLDSRPRVAEAAVTVAGGVSIEVPLDGVHVHGTSRISGGAGLQRPPSVAVSGLTALAVRVRARLQLHFPSVFGRSETTSPALSRATIDGAAVVTAHDGGAHLSVTVPGAVTGTVTGPQQVVIRLGERVAATQLEIVPAPGGAGQLIDRKAR